jgi:hypothetical protein
VPAGSHLIINKPLAIPDGLARVFIQARTTGASANPFRVHCQLQVEDVSRGDLTVRPGDFIVRKVTRTEVHSVARATPVRLAGLDLTGDMLDGSSDIMLGWDLWLDSAEQPHVRKLTCGGIRDAPSRAQRPSIAEIRAALEGVAELRLPAS